MDQRKGVLVEESVREDGKRTDTSQCLRMPSYTSCPRVSMERGL